MCQCHIGYLFRDKISMGLESHSGNDRPGGTEHGRAGTEENDVDNRSLAHSMIHASMLRHALSLLPPLRALTCPSSRTMSTYARNTLTRLYFQSPSSASATSSALLAPSAEAPPSSEARESLDSLAAHAQAAAEALACGSILAGHSSESDDYADVPLWLGAAGERPEPSAVLRALGLEAWEESGKVRSVFALRSRFWQKRKPDGGRFAFAATDRGGAVGQGRAPSGPEAGFGPGGGGPAARRPARERAPGQTGVLCACRAEVRRRGRVLFVRPARQ
jgi:hypothetical protein